MRHRLANRRELEAFDFTHAGITYHATIGRFDDGSIAEIFIDSKPGSAADILAKSAATTLSIALQHDTPIDVLRSALPLLADGRPADPLGVAGADIHVERPATGLLHLHLDHVAH